MTTPTLPIELQAVDQRIRSLVKPPEPSRHDPVRESEAISEDDNLLAWIQSAREPWWSEDAKDSPDVDNPAVLDFLLGVTFVPLIVAFLASFIPGLGTLVAVGLYFLTVIIVIFALTKFHIQSQRAAHRVLYNRVIRRNWTQKMLADTEERFQEDVTSYPQRLREYEAARKIAFSEAKAALRAYHDSQPPRRYKLGDNGFE